MGNSNESECLDLGPIGDFDHDLVQIGVEVAFEDSVLLVSRKECVSIETRRKGVLSVL